MEPKNALATFVPQSIPEAEKLAVRLSQSNLLPDALRGKPADVLVTLITGHELGLSPMQAVRGINVIKGRAVMSADLTIALAKKHPECVYFRLLESTPQRATYETERKGEGPTKMSFTMDDAQRAGLNGDNWRKYPAAMLRARCGQALARAVYPDLMLGVYDPDEAREFGGPPAPPPVERDVTPPPQEERRAAPRRSITPVEAEIVVPPPAPTVDASPLPVYDAQEPPPPTDEDAPPQEEPFYFEGEEPPQPKVPSGLTYPFGKSKGMAIEDVDSKGLHFWADRIRKDLADASKSKWHSKSRQELETIERELASR